MPWLPRPLRDGHCLVPSLSAKALWRKGVEKSVQVSVQVSATKCEDACNGSHEEMLWDLLSSKTELCNGLLSSFGNDAGVVDLESCGDLSQCFNSIFSVTTCIQCNMPNLWIPEEMGKVICLSCDECIGWQVWSSGWVKGVDWNMCCPPCCWVASGILA